MDAEGAHLLVLRRGFMGGLAGRQKGQRRKQRQIDVESQRINFHSGTTKSHHAKKVKTLMGRQSNKTIKKKRRLTYIKRKKTTVKAKRAAAQTPAAPAK
jgi:hypothetical protein